MFASSSLIHMSFDSDTTPIPLLLRDYTIFDAGCQVPFLLAFLMFTD